MKKVNKIFNAITISLLILIGIGILGTYLSDYLVRINWFGDYEKTVWEHFLVALKCKIFKRLKELIS